MSSTTTVAHQCRYCGYVAKNGTGHSAHERGCKSNPAVKPTQKQLEREERIRLASLNPDHQCPECAAEGNPRGFTNAGSLGTHRRSQHGVIGRVSASKQIACTFEGCDFKGKTREGVLIHYSRMHRPKPSGDVEVMTNGNGNGHMSPAVLRKSVQHQLRNRADLVAIVQIAFPEGIDTHDASALDNDLGYISQTAQILERR